MAKRKLSLDQEVLPNIYNATYRQNNNRNRKSSLVCFQRGKKKNKSCLIIVILIVLLIISGISAGIALVIIRNSSSQDIELIGSQLLSAGYDGQVILWDVNSRQSVKRILVGGEIDTIHAGKNNKLYIAGRNLGGQNKYILGSFDMDGKRLIEYEGIHGTITRSVTSNNDAYLFCSSTDGNLYQWFLSDSRVSRVIRNRDTQSLDIFYDSSKNDIYMSGTGLLISWNVDSQSIQNSANWSSVTGTLVSPTLHQQKLYVGNNEGKIFYSIGDSFTELRSIQIGVSQINRIAGRGDRLYIAGPADQRLTVWDFAENRTIPVRQGSANGKALDLVVLGKNVYVACEDGKIEVYQLNGEVSFSYMLDGHDRLISSLSVLDKEST